MDNDATLIAGLGQIVGQQGLLLGDDMGPYVSGARYGAGRALCVVRPASAREVSELVAFCVANRIHLVPQGANTGLVGSSTPDASAAQVVLSLRRLKQECTIHAANRTVTVDAGLTLHELNQQLEPHGLWFPIDLSADPTIGGMVATNTGGTRLIRYGDVRHNLLALDVVLFNPPGELVHFGSALRKDNTGCDLKQLFVGTSGAGGIITRATLEVHPRPRQSATALIVPVSDAAVNGLLAALEAELGDFLSAFEGMSGNAMRAAVDHVPNLRKPFAPEPVPDFAVLVELESSSSAALTGLDLQATLNRFMEAHFDTLIANAVVGDGEDLWHLRHGISEGARCLGKMIAFDVSVPRDRMMEFRQVANELVRRDFGHLSVIDFGHVADGGLHFNVVWPHACPLKYDPVQAGLLRDAVYALVIDDFDGSYSAEHGVGPHNLPYYQKYTGATVKALARGVRQLIDPLALCGTVDFGPQA